MPSSKKRVVIVGGNFAGLVAASRLSTCVDVTVVDPGAEFEWTPNIHEIISGVKSRDSVVLPRAECVTRYGHTFIEAAAVHIDHASNTVATESGLLLPYDACIIAAGSQKTQFGVPGALEHSIGLRKVDDAIRIRDRLDKLATRKRVASVVIVGGGVSGIEVAGEILRRRANGDRFHVHVVEQASRLMPQLPDSLSRDAIRRCEAHDVQIHTSASIAGVAKRSVTLDSGAKLTADLCIWSAGTTLPDFLKDSDLDQRDHDGLSANPFLQSSTADNVFMAGDCAAPDEPVRKQAYNAMDMGRTAADNVSRFFKNRSLSAFRPSPTPMLIAFGDVTTWLVAGDHVVASPLLAAGKEAVYQATMARLASPGEPLHYASGIAGRASLSASRLLLPQLTPRAILRNLTQGRILS